MRCISFLWEFLLIVVGSSLFLEAAQPPRVKDSKCPVRTYSIRVPTKNNKYREVYRICYNFNNRMALYAHHRIYAFQQDAHHRGSAGDTHCHGHKWANNSLFTNRHVSNLDTTQIAAHLYKLIRWKPSYGRGHLVPCGDFIRPDEQSATFQMVNAVPQLSSLNQGAWHSLEVWLRERAKLRPAVVVTGVLGELQHKSETIHLINGKYVSIPEFIYKVAHVQYRADGGVVHELLTFIAYNGYKPMHPLRLAAHCLQTGCSRIFPRIYCCDSAEFIRRHLPGYKKYFKII